MDAGNAFQMGMVRGKKTVFEYISRGSDGFEGVYAFLHGLHRRRCKVVTGLDVDLVVDNLVHHCQLQLGAS